MLLDAFVVMRVNMELPMRDPPVSSSSVFAATLELHITGGNATYQVKKKSLYAGRAHIKIKSQVRVY